MGLSWPCRSDKFHLEGKEIVCDVCLTRWDLETLQGNSGECLDHSLDRLFNMVQGGKLLIIEGGDFFSSVPAGADAYIMQHIIHDWEDRDAIAILRNCRKAMRSDSRVLLVEMVIPPGNGHFFGKWLDLMMLLVGGRERTEEEYRRLFSAAGLKLNRAIPTASEVSIVLSRPDEPDIRIGHSRRAETRHGSGRYMVSCACSPCISMMVKIISTIKCEQRRNSL